MRTLFASIAILGCAIASAQTFSWAGLQPPASGYVLDEAHILGEQTIRQINGICGGTAQARHVPIVVVTLSSLGTYSSGDSIETYATRLFNSWQIGSASDNRAALVLVCPNERKARIELGAGWGSSRNLACQAIMDDLMVPYFKEGDYPRGIIEGVNALDHMIRTGKTPIPKALKIFIGVVVLILGGVVVCFVIDLAKRLPLGTTIKPLFASTGRHSYYGGSMYSSGSSWSSGGGGGSSSGGGASGSW